MQATHTINSTEVDTVAAVEQITDGRMADVVVEVVGHQTETINQCMDSSSGRNDLGIRGA